MDHGDGGSPEGFLGEVAAWADKVELEPTLAPARLYLGPGPSALEVVVVHAPQRPSDTLLRKAWSNRQANRAVPLLLVFLYGDKAALCGASGEKPPVYADVDLGVAERICAAALRQPHRHAALRLLYQVLPYLDAALLGLRNEGFLTLWELQEGVPQRPDLPAAKAAAEGLLPQRGRELLSGLGFALEKQEADDFTYLLKTQDRRRAVAVLLLEGESPDLASPRFHQMSPVSYALAVAEREEVPYVLLVTASGMRLHPVKDGTGVAQRGRTETYVEINLDLLPAASAGYLWLLFSASALQPEGTFEDILERARRHATGIGERLRERIYRDVIPALALALWRARGVQRPTAADLAETYEMSLTLLFRLLFIAYAEDKELLPYRSNMDYRRHSLKELAQELHRARQQRVEPGEGAVYWELVRSLWHAVDQGQPEWGVPQYDGQLFTSDPQFSPVGAMLEEISLPDSEFVPILRDLLIDQAPEEGIVGPVDFTALGVREFGTIYEGLLESEISIADTDLTTKQVKKEQVYWPVTGEAPGTPVVVPQGAAYLHTASGARKATGSYYTKDFAVQHLLDHALEPALAAHLERLSALDETEAGERFFDFRVADIAMGSGHFLVAAVDRIEIRLSKYLADRYLAGRPLPGVREELARLRQAAEQALGPAAEGVTIEDAQLLRRQIARRCIYGVDLNPLAVQLARVSLWIHTFVPGLPLSFLDHNLLPGNSLVGIATIAEAQEELRQYVPVLFSVNAEQLLGAAREPLDRLAHITDATAGEVQRARQAQEEAQEAVAPTAALFDVLTAARLDEGLRTRLGIGRGTDQVGQWMREPGLVLESPELQEAGRILADLPPLHFPVAFPEVFLRDEGGGFNCILGNPPWEKAKVEDKGFWGRHYPGYFSLSQLEREQRKREVTAERPDLVHQLGEDLKRADLLRRALISNPTFTLGAGDPDLFVAFAWRFWQLLRTGGDFGVVLPRQIFMAKPAEPVRRTWLAQGMMNDATFLLNRQQWAFDDLHPQFTVVLVSVQKPARPATEASSVPVRGPFASLERFREGTAQAPLLLPVAGVLEWSDAAALPLLPDEEAGEVFLQLRRSPNLGLGDRQSWRVRPYAELHSTHSKPLMDLDSRECPEGFWPVFKGESFDLWTPDTGTYYAWAEPKTVRNHLFHKRLKGAQSKASPFHEFPRPWALDPETLPCLRPRIAFRDITNRTNSRTVVVALAPPRVFITEVAPYLLWPRGDERDQAFLLGVLSSVPLDWYARRFVEGHLKYMLLNAFPVPRPGRDNPLWQRVVQLAGRLAARDDRFAEWAEQVGVECGPLPEAEKDDMIAELDAVVAHLYSLSERQLIHLFGTFHEGWDYSTRLRAVQGHFAQWQARLP